MIRLLPALLLLVAANALAQPQPSTADLLNQLRAAPDEPSATALEQQIRARCATAATPAVRLLLSRGQREISENAGNDAVDSFDAALDLEPDLLDAWRGRALARMSLGDYAGAVHDIQEALQREPRDFAALQDLSRLAERRGDWKGALAAWQKLLEIDPHTQDAADRLKDLRRRALGEET